MQWFENFLATYHTEGLVIARRMLKDQADAIARKALERKSGARGLRAIIEDVMQDTMFDLPGMDDVAKCIITEDAVDKKAAPTLVKKTDALPAPKKRRTTKKAKAETEEVLPEAEANA